MTLTPAEAREQPLLTEADMIDRIDDLLAPAVNPGQLWILFLDDLRRQLPLMVPIDEVPARPKPEAAAALAGIMREVTADTDACSVIYVLERAGTDRMTAADRCWAGELARTVASTGLDVAGTFLLNRGRVQPLRP